MGRLQKFISLLPLLLFAACSHPTQSQAPKTPAAQPPFSQPQATAIIDQPTTPSSADPGASEDNRPVIVAFGDSLTAGYGAGPGQSYPDFLQEKLAKNGYNYRMVNLGVSGNTTKDGLARLPDVLRLKPQLVIVGFGGNDGLRGVPVAEIRENLSQILVALQRAHAKVLLAGITLPPNYGEVYVTNFNAVYPDLARQYHVPLVPFILQDVWDRPGMMQADGIHPTGEGNALVALNILPAVLPLLHKSEAHGVSR
jgi:acyl-CoA thioesterase-1